MLDIGLVIEIKLVFLKLHVLKNHPEKWISTIAEYSWQSETSLNYRGCVIFYLPIPSWIFKLWYYIPELKKKKRQQIIPVTTGLLDHIINLWPQFYRICNIIKDNTAAGMKFRVYEAKQLSTRRNGRLRNTQNQNNIKDSWICHLGILVAWEWSHREGLISHSLHCNLIVTITAVFELHRNLTGLARAALVLPVFEMEGFWAHLQLCLFSAVCKHAFFSFLVNSFWSGSPYPSLGTSQKIFIPLLFPALRIRALSGLFI